ncbi:MAG: MFS transporter [Actinomycetota bacterium]
MRPLRAVTGLPSYLLAATSARIGDEMVGVAAVLLVLERTGSPRLAGAVAGAYLVPTVLSGPVLGAWLDRTRYRRAALAANQVLLAVAMSALVVVVGSAPGWTAPVLASLVGLSVPMTSGGFTSLLPRFVPAGVLGRVHALEGISFNASAILGPAVAATVAVAVSPAAAVLTIAGFAAVSLAALPGVPRTSGRGTGWQRGIVRSVRDGIAHLARTPELRSVTLATSSAFVGVGMLTVALPLRAGELAGDAALGGYVWAAIEAGAVVGALAWGRWHALWRPERVVLVAVAGYGAVMLSWPAAPALTWLIALAAVAGLANGAGMPALFTARQRYTPGELYGQLSTTGASLKLGAFAAGAALGGQLVPAIGAGTVLFVVAVIQLVAAGLGRLAAGSRHRRATGPGCRTSPRADRRSARPVHRPGP